MTVFVNNQYPVVGATTEGLLYLTVDGVKELKTPSGRKWKSEVSWTDQSGATVTSQGVKPVTDTGSVHEPTSDEDDEKFRSNH